MNQIIECHRLHTSFAIRQLLSDDVLGTMIETEINATDLFGRDTITHVPLRIISFAGLGRRFPLVAVSMLLSTVSTVFFLSSLPSGSSSSDSTSLLARRIPALHQAASSSRYQSLTPLQARVKRLQEEHSAMQRASASSEAVSSSAASVSTEMMTPAPTPEPSSAPSASEPSAPQFPPARFARFDNQMGVYLTASSVSRKDFFESTIENLLASSGSALVMDVKGGSVLFHSAAPMANDLKLVRPFYELPEIIQKLHEKNIYVIGRFVAIKDDGFTSKMPETKIRHPKTGKVLSETWVDPANDAAIEYNMQVMCELAAAGIDEINLDYIRFSTAQFGALGVYSATEKADRVEKFIKASRETINRCGPNTKLGLSTFAILGWDYDINVATLGQDVVRFAPLVDVISPMAYPATFTSAGYYVPGKNPGPRNYYLVYRTLKGYTDLLGPEHAPKIRPWIQGYSVTSKDVADQIRGVYDAGYCGFTVWNAGNNYKPSYHAIKTDKIRPAHCVGDSQAVALQ